MSGSVRVALYARVSTRDKDQDPEVQLAALRSYVAARGWVATEYVDMAAAGDLAHRTAWRQLLEDVTRRRVDRVMVWKLDRAFRSTLHALSTLRDFEHHGVGFASLTQPELDTSTPTGRLVFTILAAVAEMERELIRDRVREGMAHAAAKGARIGRPPVTARPGFSRRWPGVRRELEAGTLSRRQAARQLRIGTATLGRLLEAGGPAAPGGTSGGGRPAGEAGSGSLRQRRAAYRAARQPPAGFGRHRAPSEEPGGPSPASPLGRPEPAASREDHHDPR